MQLQKAEDKNKIINLAGKRRFRFKRLIILAVVMITIAALAIIIKAIDFGKLTVNIIEKNAHVKINYGGMKGNILKGFAVQDYNIKFSESDSAYGEYGEINYRLSFRRLGLPSLFEINLFEPTINITQKKTSGKETDRKGFTPPNLHLGLRVNLKNGKVIYKNDATYEIEKISGLMFIDFVGTRIYGNTMNLTFNIPRYKISVTSLNMAVILSAKEIEVRSLKLKAQGAVIDGDMNYNLQTKTLTSTLKKADIDLERFGLHKGRVNCRGRVGFSNGKFKPQLQGFCEGLNPIDRCKFETSYLGDTIIINCFDGEIYDGSFFAQMQFTDFKHWTLETNFRNVNISRVLNYKEPVLVNGFIGYQNNQFNGFVNSTADSGVAVDSLYFYGYYKDSRINLDSLLVKEGKDILRVAGSVWPKCSLNIFFNDFTVNRWTRYAAIQGTLDGHASITGDLRDFKYMKFSTDLESRDLTLAGISTGELALKTSDFKMGEPIKFLKLKINKIAFKSILSDSASLSVDNGSYFIKAFKAADSLVLDGEITKEWDGKIEHMFLSYHGATATNKEPIAFNLPAKQIGAFNIDIFGGSLKGTLSPFSIMLTDIKLEQLGSLAGLKTPITGTMNFEWNNQSVKYHAHDINFLGFKNGTLRIDGTYQNNALAIDTLIASDESNQQVAGHGLLSMANSDFTVTCENLRMWIFPFLKSIMTNPDGIISGTVRFKGNIDDFSLSGNGTLDKGAFGLKIIGDEFDSVQSNIKFEGQRIVFEKMQGKVHLLSDTKHMAKSSITGGGYIKLEPRFRVKNLNFDFGFRDAQAQFLPYAYGKGSGNFTVGMKDMVSYYNGNVNVQEGVVPIEFGMQVDQVPETKPVIYRMNVKISGDRNIWLRNRDADIELGGEIYMIKESGPLYITGNLETKRGNYYWLNHTLTITEGKIIFIPEAEMIDPQLDIWAELNTRERSSESNEEIKIKLHFFGTLLQPVFEFFTEPEGIFTEQDIIAYLNLNTTWHELESMKLGQQVGEVLPRSLLSWLESDVSRRIRAYTGLDYLRIDAPLFQPDEKTKLTVGKYVSRNLFITYTYDITSFANEFNVEYFIDDRNEILIRRDEVGEYGLEYQYRIRF